MCSDKDRRDTKEATRQEDTKAKAMPVSKGPNHQERTKKGNEV